VRVAGIALGIGGGEDGVHEDESADDLRSQTRALAVAYRHEVGSSAVAHVDGMLERLHQTRPADGAQALRHHVRQRPRQRDLTR